MQHAAAGSLAVSAIAAFFGLTACSGTDAAYFRGGDAASSSDSPASDASSSEAGAIESGDVTNGACGGSQDCPEGQACNPATHTCGASCAGELTCHGGCCNGASCVTGNGPHACGATGGACLDCVSSADGPVCFQGGKCGCSQSSECPAGHACKGQACGTACDPGSPCNGGCCGSGGQCAGGTGNDACGNGGGACLDCTTSCNPGPVCTNFKCGCTSFFECNGSAACGLRKSCSAQGQCF
jgi:hypothetical protein